MKEFCLFDLIGGFDINDPKWQKELNDYWFTFWRNFNMGEFNLNEHTFPLAASTIIGTHSLKYDIKETDEAIEYSVLLPGVEVNDIDINFQENENKTLIVEVLKDSQYIKKNKYRINVKGNIDSSNITSILKQGVLNINVPKISKKSEIKIKVE